MPDYSKCTPDRVTEIKAFLASDKIDLAIRALSDSLPNIGQWNPPDDTALEIDFPRIGLDVRVTQRIAQIIVHDPTPEIMDAVADFDNSGRSFLAVYD